jgi:hypothetical protein
MCAQLDLKVMCKRPQKNDYYLVFMNFGMKKFSIKNYPKSAHATCTLLFHILTPKGPKSVDGFLGSSGRLSWHQKHE